SITIETAIALPLLLFSTCAVLQIPLAVRAGQLLRIAAENTAAETALAMAALDMAGVDEAMENLLEKAVGDMDAASRLVDAGTVLLGGSVLRARMIHWLVPDTGADPSLRLLHGLDVRTEGALTDGAVYLHVECSVSLLIGSRPLSFDTLLPISSLPALSGTAEKDDDIWSLGNLERGRILRIRNGGNLPLGYPVIAAFRDGTAVSIRSMDTTAPGLREEGAVYAALCRELDALSGFDGTRKPWGKNGIAIAPGDIRNREFLLVVPDNPMEETVRTGIETARSYAESLGIRLTLSAQGTSVRSD
ncbi:MAG: hypothetical protein KBA30_06115, partial [Clostridia bacterium]|nr:hypothetical protein [Clostridia bacterium]